LLKGLCEGTTQFEFSVNGRVLGQAPCSIRWGEPVYPMIGTPVPRRPSSILQESDWCAPAFLIVRPETVAPIMTISSHIHLQTENAQRPSGRPERPPGPYWTLYTDEGERWWYYEGPLGRWWMTLHGHDMLEYESDHEDQNQDEDSNSSYGSSSYSSSSSTSSSSSSPFPRLLRDSPQAQGVADNADEVADPIYADQNGVIHIPEAPPSPHWVEPASHSSDEGWVDPSVVDPSSHAPELPRGSAALTPPPHTPPELLPTHAPLHRLHPTHGP